MVNGGKTMRERIWNYVEDNLKGFELEGVEISEEDIYLHFFTIARKVQFAQIAVARAISRAIAVSIQNFNLCHCYVKPFCLFGLVRYVNYHLQSLYSRI